MLRRNILVSVLFLYADFIFILFVAAAGGTLLLLAFKNGIACYLFSALALTVIQKKKQAGFSNSILRNSIII
jgi:hypothetical protein